MASQEEKRVSDSKTRRLLQRKIDPDNPETFAMAESLLIPDIRKDFGAGLEIGETLQFKAVPVSGPRTLDEPWRALLIPTEVEKPTIALDVWGDAAIGRGVKIDVDLTDYNGIEMGVSRRHALLRPTRTALFLIDLLSSNGTHLNGVPLGSGMALRLSNEDVVAFGNLHFTVRVVHTPAGASTE